MFVPQMAAQIVLVIGVLCRRRRRRAGRQSILLYYTAHRDRRVLKESASRGAVAEMQAQQPRRREHVQVDQKADGDSNGVFFNRRQTLKHLVQLLELSSGITRRAETQGLRFRSTRYLCISPQIHPQNVNVFSCCC